VTEGEQTRSARGCGEGTRAWPPSFFPEENEKHGNISSRLVQALSATVQKRFFAAVEIVVALGLYFVTLWRVAPHAGEPWANGAFVAVMLFAVVYVLAVSPFIHRDTRTDRGLGGWRSGFVRHDNLRGAAVLFGIVTLVSAILIVLIALWLDASALSKVNRLTVWAKFLGYVPFTLVQDMFFYGFVFQRLLTVCPRPAQSEGLPGTIGAAARNDARHRLIIAGVMDASSA